MARKVAVTNLDASTIDILNVIRGNASYAYQASVPKVRETTDIPKVGEAIYGTPANMNEFLHALVNRIALVKVNSATFNNPYKRLKKGVFDYGESIEDVFIAIAKVTTYNPEKGEEREFKRSIPDVKSVFYTVNWRVMYPVTIQEKELRHAFTNVEGVTDLISKIVESVYQASEYDEYLLFKYLLIKAVANGKMRAVEVGDGKDLNVDAGIYRGMTNDLTFMKTENNEAGVRVSTPRNRQIIFMDSKYNGKFDVEVLASAFNMGKADLLGSLYLIDDFTTFDNERFEELREQSDGLEEVTDSELALMGDVTAILVDENFFQVYDNLAMFTEKYVASGLYWNYFYHIWKVVATSPYANAVVFVKKGTEITMPESITVHVEQKLEGDGATVFVLTPEFEAESWTPKNVQFTQTKEAIDNLVAVQPYGVYIIPESADATELEVEATINGVVYKDSATKLSHTTDVDATFTLTKV